MSGTLDGSDRLVPLPCARLYCRLQLCEKDHFVVEKSGLLRFLFEKSFTRIPARAYVYRRLQSFSVFPCIQQFALHSLDPVLPAPPVSFPSSPLLSSFPVHESIIILILAARSVCLT